MNKEEKEHNEKENQQQKPGFFANLMGTFVVMLLKQELQQIMNGCREITEIYSRETREAKIELNKEIIEKAYKLRLRCYRLTEKLAYSANLVNEKYVVNKLPEEIKTIQKERKEFWEFFEKEMEKLKKEIEENRIAEKAVQKIIEMAKDGKESSKRFDSFDIKNGMPIFQ